MLVALVALRLYQLLKQVYEGGHVNGGNRPDKTIVDFTILVCEPMPLRNHRPPRNLRMRRLERVRNAACSLTDDLNLSLDCGAKEQIALVFFPSPTGNK